MTKVVVEIDSPRHPIRRPKYKLKPLLLQKGTDSSDETIHRLRKSSIRVSTVYWK